MKILIGWEAFAHDYTRGTGLPSPTGPNLGFHQHFIKEQGYEKHILLTAGEQMGDLKRIESLRSYILSIVNESIIETHQIPVKDVIDVNEIQNKLRAFIAEFNASDELHFYISPGTSAMQIAWHLLHLEGSHETKLIQTRPADKSKTGKPELLFIELERSNIPTTLIQKETIDNQPLRIADDILITTSLRRVYDNARKVASTDKIPVLIQGPTGSGKENLAKFIHDSSSRAGKPFTTINCAAFDDNLLLSELFGHEKGAFTGANEKRKGLFEEANGGTIFLDEIGDISPFTQQALLRVIQSGEVRPLGSSKTKFMNLRIITATHKDLKQLCSEEQFRWDLFYRISTAVLQVPSLIDRGLKEKEEYLNHLLGVVAKDLNKKALELSGTIRKQLLAYHYPGNLREMYNIISTLYVFHENGKVTTSEYLPKLSEDVSNSSTRYEDHEIPFMRKHIIKVLKMTNGNISRAADKIGWVQNTLRKNMEKVGLEIEDFRNK